MDKKKRKKLTAKKLEIRRQKRMKEEEKERAKTAVYHKYPNGKNVHECMVGAGYGGDVRDYMVLVGNRMVDYKGSYDMVLEGGGKVGVGDDEIRVMHKKRLKYIIGETAALRFWHPTFGRLIDVKQGTKPKPKK